MMRQINVKAQQQVARKNKNKKTKGKKGAGKLRMPDLSGLLGGLAGKFPFKK